MIRTIAVVPQPPLLVPELVGAATAEVDPLRMACEQAVRRLGAPRWHAVGADCTGPALFSADTHSSFRGYGVDVPVELSNRPPLGPPTPLPLPLLVAGWLRSRAGAKAVVGELVHPSTPPTECVARGKELADELSRDGTEWAVLVLADGARTHAVPGAGWVDERAGGFDEAIGSALRHADAAALAAIDPDLAAALGADGRAALQVLAGVVIGSGLAWAGELLYSAAPYGVGYHVALWEPLLEPHLEPHLEPR